MKCRILLLLLLSSSLILNSQNPSVNWDKTLGGENIEYPSELVVLESGGLIVCGSSDSDISGDKTEDTFGPWGDSDFWVVKLDENQNIEWDKTIGGDFSDFYPSALVTDELIYLLGRSFSDSSGVKTSPNYGSADIWLVCMDLDGNILWDESYGGEGSEFASELIHLINGNLLIAGASTSGATGVKTDESNGEADYWVLEVNPDNGEIIQQKGIGSAGYEYMVSVTEDNQGNILLMGTAPEGISGDKSEEGYGGDDLWLVKLNSDFEIIMDKCIGGEQYESPGGGDVLLFNNHYYVTIGSNSPVSGNKTAPNYGERDYWLIKLTTDLEIVWDKTFGGNIFDYPRSLLAHSSSSIVLSGSSESPISGTRTVEKYGTRDIWILFLDEEGNEFHQESYGGDTWEAVGQMFSASENSSELFVLSNSNSDASGVKTEDSRGDFDYWILSLDASTYLSVEDFEETAFQISTYPNPFSSTIQFDLTEVDEPQELSIYSSAGKLVHRQKFNNAQRYTWQPTNAEAGIYFYVLKCEDAVVRGKVVKN